MSIWLVRAILTEDEVEASEQWEVNADTAHDAVKEATTHIRFRPHHVEARIRSSGGENVLRTSGLQPGEVRRVPPQ